MVSRRPCHILSLLFQKLGRQFEGAHLFIHHRLFDCFYCLNLVVFFKRCLGFCQLLERVLAGFLVLAEEQDRLCDLLLLFFFLNVVLELGGGGLALAAVLLRGAALGRRGRADDLLHFPFLLSGGLEFLLDAAAATAEVGGQESVVFFCDMLLHLLLLFYRQRLQDN